jgi:hypothetical protein
VLALDLNGDGLADLVHLSHKFQPAQGAPTLGFAGFVTWMSKGDGTFDVTKSPYPEAVTGGSVGGTVASWQLLDVNGDGLLDLVNLAGNAGNVIVLLSKGDGSFAVSQFPSTTDTNLGGGSWQVLDFNGDGLSDLVHLTTTNDDYRIWLSKGDGTFDVSASKSTGNVDPCMTCGKWFAMDTAGDGFADLVHMSDDQGRYGSWFLSRHSADVPMSISNGLGARVAWEQRGLAQILGKSESSYSMSVSSSGGRWTVVPPMQVVTSSQATTGVGGERKTTYSYDSAQMERNGRGFLGFNWLQSVDEMTGVVTRTVSNLNFPYTGMTSQALQGLSLASGFNLGSTTTAYDCVDPASTTIPPAPCTVGPGKRYFVYPKTVDARTWDLNGKPMPRTRTETLDVDAYGNVGRIITSTLDANGNATAYAKTVVNTYAVPDLGNWYLGRLLKSTATSTGPDIPAPVVQGTGGLPPAPAPQLPAQLLQVILSILLDD